MSQLKIILTSLLTGGLAFSGQCAVLWVGVGQTYSSIEAAATVAMPGDTIRVKNGVSTQKQNLINLQGTSSAGIVIEAETTDSVFWRGGNEAWHLTDVAYLEVAGFVFEQQKVNGVNIDDGGSYETPSHHVLIRNCTFRDMDASGNNDLLKLSGLNDFQIRNCLFQNGSEGGSGVDMVGCHRGSFLSNRWENMGSNCIQAKGGTQYLVIERNWFENGGGRALNLGGSTGLQFFRPIDAPFEAADILVNSNVIVGADAAVSFTGSVRVEVSNNTIYKPGRWVFRILQETVDTTRFAKCGLGRFNNNLVVVDDQLSTTVNVGPNTAPETFEISNNLWHHTDLFVFEPSLPVGESNGVYGQKPRLKDEANMDFDLQSTSPAIGKAKSGSVPKVDFLGRSFNSPASIGAFEGNPSSSSARNHEENHIVKVFPNPVHDVLRVSCSGDVDYMHVVDVVGRDLCQVTWENQTMVIDTHDYPNFFMIQIGFSDGSTIVKSVVRFK